MQYSILHNAHFFRPFSDHFQRINFRENCLKNGLNVSDRFQTKRLSVINIYLISTVHCSVYLCASLTHLPFQYSLDGQRRPAPDRRPTNLPLRKPARLRVSFSALQSLPPMWLRRSTLQTEPAPVSYSALRLYLMWADRR